MEFALVCIGIIVALGLVALVADHFDRGSDAIEHGHDCSTCSEAGEGNCKLHELMEHCKKHAVVLIACLLLLPSCSTKKNTAQSRFWQSFTARYNTYFNGSQAFIEGSIEKEDGNHDNCTELIPL